MESFIERLYRLTRQNGITMGKVAEAAGISQNGISNWKKRGSMPPADTAIALAKTLNVSVEYLINGEDSLKENNLEDKINKLSPRDKQLVTAMIDLMISN